MNGTTLTMWFEITSRGTSGDQVTDILYDWKADREQLLQQIAKLEFDARWILVSESLPEKEEGYQFSRNVEVYDGEEVIAEAYLQVEDHKYSPLYKKGHWYHSDGREIKNVTHWRTISRPSARI